MSERRRFSEVSGFVLAGGESRRVGFDKAQLLLGSERLVDRQIRLLRAMCRSVAILGPPDRFVGPEVQVYEDEISGQGPLGGIRTGLHRAHTDFSLFLACDMPFMEKRFLRYLCEQALGTRALVTLPPPWSSGRYPICAVLRRGVLARLSSYLESGQNQVGRFFSRCPRRAISRGEFARAGFSARLFCNLNTLEEYERMRQQWVQ
jgi:molybdopterin-guanine dinucleotide biosynthesis protein A